MRWILCGKNDAAVEILEFLVDAGDQVLAVASHGDSGRDGWQRSFAGAALRRGVPLERPPRINAPACIERLAAFGAQALLSVQYDQILRGELLRGVGCACLNFHFALLPRHRGVAPIAWAILEGDERAGVTLHHMVEAIDAGDVIARAEVPVEAGDSARDLYDRVWPAALRLFRESYPFAPELLARRLRQDAAAACYHRRQDLDFAERRVDWKQPAAALHRWLRALIFPPMQHPETLLDGRALRIERVAAGLGAPTGAAPGTVLDCGAGGIDVAAADRALRIIRLSALDDAPTPPIRVGDRLG